MEEIKQKLIPVYILGKKYEVPEGSTIIGAFEYAGYQLKKGIGCREGFCGACATVYRLPGDYKLKGGLGCQTVVQPGMQLVQIPFSPTQRANYKIEELKPQASTITALYPEVYRCVSCNTCTKICPQDIKVMDYIQAAIRGDIAQVADLSFDCIMCGLCAMRCPAEIPQYNIAILARRLYGRYLSKRGEYLKGRIEQIERGEFDKGIEELTKLNREELQRRYKERELNFEIT